MSVLICARLRNPRPLSKISDTTNKLGSYYFCRSII